MQLRKMFQKLLYPSKFVLKLDDITTALNNIGVTIYKCRAEKNGQWTIFFSKKVLGKLTIKSKNIVELEQEIKEHIYKVMR